MKEGGSLFGGTCEHCEDRAPSGPRQDSVRTLSGLCQDCQDSCGSSTNQVFRGPHELAFIPSKIFIYPQFACPQVVAPVAGRAPGVAKI